MPYDPLRLPGIIPKYRVRPKMSPVWCDPENKTKKNNTVEGITFG